MHAREALMSRRTIHFYETTPLPEGALERALNCALRAPNHKLTNPWRFTLAGPETRAAITELGVRLKQEKGPLSEAKLAKIRDKLSSPPVLLFISQLRTDDDFRAREDYAAVACAIQNASVSLWSEGVGSKWSSGAVTRHEEAYQIAGIDPEREEIVGFLWAGIPREEVPETPRLPLDAVFRQIS